MCVDMDICVWKPIMGARGSSRLYTNAYVCVYVYGYLCMDAFIRVYVLCLCIYMFIIHVIFVTNEAPNHIKTKFKHIVMH